jgi:hypothetical protein
MSTPKRGAILNQSFLAAHNSAVINVKLMALPSSAIIYAAVKNQEKPWQA